MGIVRLQNLFLGRYFVDILLNVDQPNVVEIHVPKVRDQMSGTDMYRCRCWPRHRDVYKRQILYIRHVFRWLRSRSPWWRAKIEALEKKAHLKGRLVHTYSAIGLCALVAIPLPGTGAWTGALVAAVLDMRLKNAVPTIFLGVCIAAGIMTMVTYGIINIL